MMTRQGPDMGFLSLTWRKEGREGAVDNSCANNRREWRPMQGLKKLS